MLRRRREVSSPSLAFVVFQLRLHSATIEIDYATESFTLSFQKAAAIVVSITLLV